MELKHPKKLLKSLMYRFLFRDREITYETPS